MRTLLLITGLLSFAFAEAQDGTIKVKKNDCECGAQDTIVAKDTLQAYSKTGPNIHISGKVTDSTTGRPLANVVLYYMIGNSKIRTGTNKEGVFFITGPPGFYMISATKDCYKFAESEIGPDESGLIICDIKLILCPKKSDPPRGNGSNGNKK
jgi:hypothetical protein